MEYGTKEKIQCYRNKNEQQGIITGNYVFPAQLRIWIATVMLKVHQTFLHLVGSSSPVPDVRMQTLNYPAITHS
jgi:hypothetical protein